MFDRVKLLVLSLIFFSFAVAAQEVTVRGQFQSDSIKIGTPAAYSLSATYPKNKTLVFPDSTFKFDLFEIDHKTYFPTKTTGNTSYDSVVYFLTSFEIDSVQLLSLPVFIVNPMDCTAVYSGVDSIYLQQLVKQLPDSVSVEQLPLKTNTAYQTVSWLMNYPLLLIIGGALIVLIIAGWVIFGKRIRQHFILRKLQKRYNNFMAAFGQSIEQLQDQYTTQKAEATLVLWKKYMEQLQTKPYTKYTTKEIFLMVKDENLANALKQIDRTIYKESLSLEKVPLLELQNYTERKFQDKVQEVRNG